MCKCGATGDIYDENHHANLKWHDHRSECPEHQPKPDQLTWDDIEGLLVTQVKHRIYGEKHRSGYDPGKSGTHIQIKTWGMNKVFAMTYEQTYDSPDLDTWEARLYRVQKPNRYNSEWEPFFLVKTRSNNNRFLSDKLMEEMIREYQDEG
jgi:hypothetical protein